MGFVLYALSSEKAVAGIEKENKLTFIVENAATKKQVKEEVEKNYGQKVRKVTALVTPLGKKKAFVVFEKAGAAAELAAKLKVI
ncbi:TPA: 50S ribosomal protein L23 [Candidatus Micrarchaeota archaeon]|nr:50S ribosomal protein L23 [Candidatus Micrarchaeota archaeon]